VRSAEGVTPAQAAVTMTRSEIGQSQGASNLPSALGAAACHPSSNGITWEQWGLGTLFSLCDGHLRNGTAPGQDSLSHYPRKFSDQTQEEAEERAWGGFKDLNTPLRAQQSHAQRSAAGGNALPLGKSQGSSHSNPHRLSGVTCKTQIGSNHRYLWVRILMH